MTLLPAQRTPDRRVVRVRAVQDEQLADHLMIASALLGRLHGEAASAMADGVIDSQERAALAPAAHELLRQAQTLVAQIEAGTPLPRAVSR